MTSRRTAWLRTESGWAFLCPTCPDYVVADARRAVAGLRLHHETCPECRAGAGGEVVTFDAGTARPEHRRAAPEGTPSAAVSTPSGAPARVDSLPSPVARRYVGLSVIAQVTGVDSYRLQTRFFPRHWGCPKDFWLSGPSVCVNVAALPELADALSEGGEPEAAAKLTRCWLSDAKGEKPLAAGSDGPADANTKGERPQIPAAPARTSEGGRA